MDVSLSFWKELHRFAWHDNLGQLLALALIVAGLLWRWRPQDRKPVAATLLFFLLTLGGLLLGGLLHTLGFDPLARGVREISILAGGMALVRLSGLFLFRLLLPLFRVQPLRILEDLAELVGYCAWFIVRLHEAGLDLSGIVTTSAVMTAVLAFSMQDTLGNILGGLALQLDNSIQTGDWIRVDDVTGRVVEIRWRYTAVETVQWETVIIPNSQLMKGKFAVLGRKRGNPAQWRRSVEFSAPADIPSGKIIQTAEKAVREGNIANIANWPSACCVLLGFDAGISRYSLLYWLLDPGQDGPTASETRSRIFAALQRAGVRFAYPEYHVDLTQRDEKHEQAKLTRRLRERLDALRHVELFSALRETELSEIGERLVYAPFAQGDTITRQGAVAHWLYILTSGEADVFLELPDGGRRRIDTVRGGQFLGEMGLMTGAPRSATVIAKTEVLAYRLDKESFQDVLARRPELAEEISALLVRRRFALENLQHELDSESAAQQMAQQQNNLLGRIRGFFGLE
ncbi:MAG TPA: mechanosensitive ion channel family protein [Methylococcaceae bacterium]|nr:mechanosensitive ion channel family protein [Methylococcaceae bacterium]